MSIVVVKFAQWGVALNQLQLLVIRFRYLTIY